MKNKEIEKIRRNLEYRIEEWVGFDIPSEGSEDHDRWLGMVHDVKDIVSIADVISYLESVNIDIDEFFIDGECDLIAAGLNPEEISISVLSMLGLEIESRKKPDDSLIRVLEYGGKYFLVDGDQVAYFSTEIEAINCALTITGPEDSSIFDLNPHSNSAILEGSKDQLVDLQERAVLIIVKNWPDGTMAFKFGSAIQSALGISKDQMSLVQLSPERIFRASTCVNEIDFRSALKERVGKIADLVLFIEV